MLAGGLGLAVPTDDGIFVGSADVTQLLQIANRSVHHSNSLAGPDVVSAESIQVGNFRGAVSQTSLVAGTTLEFGARSQLTAGYAVPVTSADLQYNNALNVQFSRIHGR